MTGPGRVRVGAVVVAYRPDAAQLAGVLEALGRQVSGCTIVVNDVASLSAAAEGLLAASPWQVLRNSGNPGLGAALNQGIAAIREQGCDAVLLLDQDSVPATDMVARLWDALAGAAKDLDGSPPVAAAGPTYSDLRDGRAAPFIRFGFPLNQRVSPRHAPSVDCDFLITSGSLIPMTALDAIGGMDASLFIDSIDIDWSMRARAAGFRLLGVGAATMGHRIGDRVCALSVGPVPLGRTIVHPPLRLYYMMRNRVLLYGRRATPGIWIAQDIPRLCWKLVCFSLLVPPRRANARAMLAGLADGLRRRSGPRGSAPALR